MSEDDLEDELRIRNPTQRQLLVQTAQALLKCEAKRRFFGQPWQTVLRNLREAFEDCLIPAAALRRTCLVGEGGFGMVYKGLWNKEIDVAIKAFRMFSTVAAEPQQCSKNPLKDLEKPKASEGWPLTAEQRRREKLLGERQRQKLAVLLLDLAEEANVLMSLAHPNITRFWGVCLDDERQWIVTQYVSGGSLFNLIHSSRGDLLDSTQITKIALGICSGMAYVHSKGLLHCDLKSPNILLDESLEAKICDFGLALRSFESPIAATRGRIGTVQWMAPEVLRGAEYSQSADVYSFGVILWEMLSRRVPLANMTWNHVVAAIGWGNHTLDAVYHCPDSLSQLMKKCLHRIASERPTFEQLVEEFAFLADSGYFESSTAELISKPFCKLKETTRRALNTFEEMLFGPPLL